MIDKSIWLKHVPVYSDEYPSFFREDVNRALKTCTADDIDKIHFFNEDLKNLRKWQRSMGFKPNYCIFGDDLGMYSEAIKNDLYSFFKK